MATKEEKQQRKALRREMAKHDRAKAEASMPILKSDLKGLFDYLDGKLAEVGCNESLRYTREFLRSRKLPEEDIVSWLGEYGGFCDCEVLANVENEWGEFVRSI
jgi:Protein of unknown function (DUF2695)